jgi:hypothetical protein
MQCSAQQGARLTRPRAAVPSRASFAQHSRIARQACGIGAFRGFVRLGADSCVPGARVSLSGSSSAGSHHKKRWQVAAGPPAFPEPDAGASVGVKDTESSPADGSTPSNGAKPGANGAVVPSHSPEGTPAAAAEAPAVQQGGVAHRWRIVFMMAVAFVLCNMDKVGFWAQQHRACVTAASDSIPCSPNHGCMHA